ncbi:MAG: hypothetical protein MJE68_11805, partial [Proteobacteria bacterium]|nr:hypothetical protein [Pseudomonadota bacterium]
GSANLKFWVADTVSCKGTPFILGGNHIKSIFNQVNSENADNWPQPWKCMYHRFSYGVWDGSDSDDLYDSDAYDTEYDENDSFEELCRFESQKTPSASNSSLDSWLKVIDYPSPHEEVDDPQDEEEGIPDLVSNEIGTSTPAAQEECPLPCEVQEHSDNGGGEPSVFTNLTGKSEGHAAEAEIPACNVKVSTPSTPQVGVLTPYPFVSCRVTPSGETVFNLQWVEK